MKRKTSKLMGVLMAGSVLVACGQSPKEAYIEAMDQSSEAQAGNFEMTIQDIALTGGDSETEAMMNIIQSQLQDMKMTGTYSMPKSHEYALDMNMSLLGKEIPLNVVGNDEHMYMSTAFLTAVMELMQSFSGTEMETTKVQALDGKYIDMEQLAAEADSTGATSGVDTSQLENLNIKDLLAYQNDLKKAFANYLRDDVKEERFTEKDGKLSFTMNEKDIEKLGDIQQKLAKDHANYEQFNIDVKGLMTELDQMKVETAIDEDTEKQTYYVDVASTKNNIDAVKLTITNTPSEKAKAVEIPKDDQLVTQEQLNDAFGANSAEVTDEQFDALLEQAKAAKTSLTPAQKEETLKQYKDYLTPAQYAELEEVLGN